MGRAKPPPMLEVTAEQVEQMLEVARDTMPTEHFAIIESLVATNVLITTELRKKRASLRRLRRLTGIHGSEKTRDVLPHEPSETHDDGGASQPADCPSSEQDATDPSCSKAPKTKDKVKARRKGHGRLGAADYPTAEAVFVDHESLRPGDPCPLCGGKLHRFRNAPVLRILGRSMLEPQVTLLGQVRCGDCQHAFTARLPDAMQGPRYDHSATAIIAIVHYQAGMPFNRIAQLQQQLQIAVPASTQWDVVNKAADELVPVLDVLTSVAAQGTVLHIDDSYVRILELMGKRREVLVADSQLDSPERTGLFTTAVVSVTSFGPVALFLSGRQHAGENLADVLDLRASGMPAPVVMSDALNRNTPKGHQIIEANCMSHARRGVVDEVDNYPDACHILLGSLAHVYRLDAQLKKNGATDEQRLLAHQRQSAPILDELHDWMRAALDGNKIEPNSSMGSALSYFLKHWTKLTLFLRQPGAPIDNNFAERVLKVAIRHRRNSLFYRSERGAFVGDLYMTLIHTAVLHGVNPFGYLTALLAHAREVRNAPERWLPWNYQASLSDLREAA